LETADTKIRKRGTIQISSEDEFLQDQAQQMRAGVYELLSAMLAKEPTDEIIRVLREIDVQQPANATDEAVNLGDGQLAMGWQLLQQASEKADTAQLREEYFDLFVGVGRGELVPFGSWYLTGFMMEKPVSVLRSDLAQLGIERQQGVSESEDHIASLCDAMAIIIRSGQEVSFDRQKMFYNDHLQPWVGRFYSDLQAARSAHFYRSVGFFGEAFASFEEQLFSMQS